MGEVMMPRQIRFLVISAVSGMLILTAMIATGSPSENEEGENRPEKTSRFKVKPEEIAGNPTRRASLSVGFELVEVLHDAFAEDTTEYVSPARKKTAQFRRGSPVDGKLRATIYSHSDVHGREDSITRLLKFLGAKARDVEQYIRHSGPFDLARDRTYTLTVLHGDRQGEIHWDLEDADGNRVTLRPYWSAR